MSQALPINQESIFNIAGVPSDDFIEEVTDSQLIKKNDIFFALLVGGLPGDPGFGVGVSELVGELNITELRSSLEKKASDTLIGLVDGIEYKGTAVKQIPGQQFISADMHFVDIESKKDILIPLAFPTK